MTALLRGPGFAALILAAFFGAAAVSIAWEPDRHWNDCNSTDPQGAQCPQDNFWPGSSGKDRMDSQGFEDNILGALEADHMFGGPDDDTIRGEGGPDELSGDQGNEIFHGNEGADFIQGNDAADLLYGEANDDTLRGGDGNDDLHAGDGQDSLNGGAGYDRCWGGPMNDDYDDSCEEKID